MPRLPESRPLSLGGGSSGRVGGGEGGGAGAKLAVPASEEAKKSLRALKAAEERARNQPLLLKALDANALDDWGDDDDDLGFDDEGFDFGGSATLKPLAGAGAGAGFGAG
ncbi:unnamed protein product, partial [Laminaria digitata]